MAGIYIHIPFCKQKCYYCDFFSVVGFKEKGNFVKSLLKEIDIQKNYLGNASVDTIYFGGGTPSSLDIEEVKVILDKLYSTFNISSDAEITFEANPEDLEYGYLPDLKELGINRLSIGIQSFNDDDLLFMNRKHSSEQAIKSVERAIKAGFTNISIDLIYGFPNLDLERWKSNLEIALSLPVTHISAYHLTIEERTVFSHYLKKGIITEMDEEDSVEQFSLLIEMAEKSGFIQYETSNFAKDNMISKHNSNYWKQVPYLGLGPSAHSYNGESRQWNVSLVNKYIDGIEANNPEFEKEIIDDNMAYNEYILTSLRTMWGIDLEYVKERFSADKYNFLLSEIENQIELKHLKLTDNKAVLTKKGLFVSDAIMSDLMIIVEE
ncbi:MAG: radical SAM family heme chaperone HemW [Bacteroidales bacterium]|nr:radical SAM family heme chaperone HemW [Bacteroidales bacterium]